MPLAVRFTRHADGGATLHCTRADGSETWQRHGAGRGRFFVPHDLLHFALESTIQSAEGFFGLIAAGWDIEETTGKTPRGPLPPQAVAVELWVSLLAAESADGACYSAGELRDQARTFSWAQERPEVLDTPAGTLPMDDALLDSVRERYQTLLTDWAAVAPGEALELTFPDSR